MISFASLTNVAFMLRLSLDSTLDLTSEFSTMRLPGLGFYEKDSLAR
jgi:hypothetical protein